MQIVEWQKSVKAAQVRRSSRQPHLRWGLCVNFVANFRVLFSLPLNEFHFSSTLLCDYLKVCPTNITHFLFHRSPCTQCSFHPCKAAQKKRAQFRRIWKTLVHMLRVIFFFKLSQLDFLLSEPFQSTQLATLLHFREEQSIALFSVPQRKNPTMINVKREFLVNWSKSFEKSNVFKAPLMVKNLNLPIRIKKAIWN